MKPIITKVQITWERSNFHITALTLISYFAVVIKENTFSCT